MTHVDDRRSGIPRRVTRSGELFFAVAGLLGIIDPAQGASIAQLDISGGSIELVLQLGSSPTVHLGGEFSKNGVLVMGQYQPPPTVFSPAPLVDGHSFSIFTHPGLDLAHHLPAPTGEVAGNVITVNLHALFAEISGPLINGALNIGTQAPLLATGSYDPATGSFEVAWAHSYQPSIQLMSLAEFTVTGAAAVAPIPPAIVLFGSGVFAMLVPGIGVRRRPQCDSGHDDTHETVPHEPDVPSLPGSGYILLISTDIPLSQDIATWFRRYGYEVDRASDLNEAVTVARQQAPSMVLVDRRQRGWEFLRQENAFRWVPMMTLVPQGTTGLQEVLADLDRGMDGYHLCEDGYRLLVARVRALMRRASLSLSEQPLCQIGDIKLDSERFHVTVAGRTVTLPLIQFRILHLLMHSPDRVYRTREIIDHVWGRGYVIGRYTLPVHIFRIRKLLGVQATEQGPIITIRNVGYKFGRPPQPAPLPPIMPPPRLQRGRLRRGRLAIRSNPSTRNAPRFIPRGIT
jgi:DNA-binding response OmpR family regulator